MSWAIFSALLYPPSERSETGGYILFSLLCACLSVCPCVCAHHHQQLQRQHYHPSHLLLPSTTHQPSHPNPPPSPKPILLCTMSSLGLLVFYYYLTVTKMRLVYYSATANITQNGSSYRLKAIYNSCKNSLGGYMHSLSAF